jgi:hypothetical protein
MTLDEILGALPNLKEEELEVIRSVLHELYKKAIKARIEGHALEPDLPPGHWTEVFKEWTGKAEDDFPEDFSLNHDHYIYGTPKKW